MVFPQETIEQARYVSQMLDRRYPLKSSKAVALFNGDFLHIQYGFDDAIRNGRCGTFLHEVERTAECFSMAGILYVVAKEMDMDPKIFYALGMKDMVEGGNPNAYGSYDHAFITVRLGKDRYLIDPYFQNFGKIDHDENRHILQVKDGSKVKNRSYAYLHHLSEEEYVSILEKNRAPGGGRLALASSQKVRSNTCEVHLEYLDGILHSSAVFRASHDFSEPEMAREIYSLSAPVLRNGETRLEEGQFSHCYARTAGWQRALYENVSNEFRIPAPVVFDYLRHMKVAAKTFGRASLRRTSSPRISEILQNAGFDEFGNLSGENGIDHRKHNALLEAIDASFETRQNDVFSRQHFERAASYLKQRTSAKTPDNPKGLLYDREEHFTMVDGLLEDLAQKNWELIKWKKTAFAAFMRKGSARKFMRILRVLDAQYEGAEQDIQGLYGLRQVHADVFHSAFDWHMFVQKTPLGTVEVSDEDLRLAHRHAFHTLMIPGLRVLPALQVRNHRKGLRRVLQE